MQDTIYQKMYFEAIFSCVLYAPVLEHHPEYCINQFSDSVPYISYDDIINSRYIIRGRSSGDNDRFDSQARAIIIRYENLDDLVNAGWRLK